MVIGYVHNDSSIQLEEESIYMYIYIYTSEN